MFASLSTFNVFSKNHCPPPFLGFLLVSLLTFGHTEDHSRHSRVYVRKMKGEILVLSCYLLHLKHYMGHIDF